MVNGVKVTIGGNISKSMPLNTGVPQGSILATHVRCLSKGPVHHVFPSRFS